MHNPPSPGPSRKPSPGPSRKPSPGPSHKPKRSSASETFKLPWSVAEQHLLQRLLEEIAQERNRWSKISLAMHGRCTPRQVASRVQKYSEKLSRTGVEGEGGEEWGGEGRRWTGRES
ncbi:hypothetical protein BJ138DRAFT_821563 [Hygrophoropsis aurantiaca]|uniref:Uncharacterized protein n=1 Tax=Hygrophoropsis aurantiaca TaxID=72124 RepID=A0ACB7ZVG2_9AGAM|nr:hypothetical protein BJ138DRAFT_821563 [Hygrophoropsis aurantiaca]